MGWKQRINISIKNDRILLLEKRAAAIEALLNQRIDIFITQSAELKDLINGLLAQEIYEMKEAQEMIYEELISRTVKGRMKRLAAWLNRGKRKL